MGWIDGFFENRGWLGMVQQNTTTGEFEVGGTAISNSYTIATMPSAASVAAGTIIRIPRSEFTTSTAAAVPGMAEDGIYLRSSDSVWVPAFSQVFSQAYSTKASPLVTIAASGAETIADITLPSGNPIVPMELLRVGFKIKMEAIVGKTGVSGGASVYGAHFGWSATYNTNPRICDANLSTGTDKSIKISSLGIITAYASAASNTVSTEVLIPNSLTGFATSGYVDRSNGLDFTKDCYCSFSIDPGVGGGTNTDALYWYKISLEP